MIGYRLVFIGPLHAGAIAALACVTTWLLASALGQLGGWRQVALGSAAKLALGGFAGGLASAAIFDLLAPLVGGLPVRLAAEPAPAPRPATEARAAADAPAPPSGAELMRSPPATTETKRCPKCGGAVRADRSFCPECDHAFG